MLKKKILKKDHVVPFLRRLSRDKRLIMPVKRERGEVLYEEVNSLDDTVPDLSRQPQESLKPFFFPQEETIFTYKTGDNGYSFNTVDETDETVFFGVRSCDISGILYMDVIFLRGPIDPFYSRRRNKAIIIGMACNEPEDKCFCYASRSGPFLEVGFDLQLTDLGNRYFVESGRARGDAIFEEFSLFFQEVTEEDEKLRYQLSLEARSLFKRQVYLETAFNRLKTGDFDEKIWAHIAKRCDRCGGCAHICPTCTCFTIFDSPIDETQGERIRAWDACTHEGFTRMAGGHNPVPPEDALKRRFMHKLYYDRLSFKRSGCVGCGRCVDMCFGGIDMASFVRLLCS